MKIGVPCPLFRFPLPKRKIPGTRRTRSGESVKVSSFKLQAEAAYDVASVQQVCLLTGQRVKVLQQRWREHEVFVDCLDVADGVDTFAR